MKNVLDRTYNGIKTGTIINVPNDRVSFFKSNGFEVVEVISDTQEAQTEAPTQGQEQTPAPATGKKKKGQTEAPTQGQEQTPADAGDKTDTVASAISDIDAIAKGE